MAISGDGYELTHVSVRGGVPIDEMLHFDLDERLSVLYGLNGAGKSRILRAIMDALSGRQQGSGRADLHLTVDVTRAPDRGFMRDFSACLSEALRETRGEMYTSNEFADYEILYEEIRAPDETWSISEKLHALADLIAAQRRLSDSDRTNLHEVVEKGRFVLQAGHDGRRILWLAARPSDSPALAESLGIGPHHLRRMLAALDDPVSGSATFSHPLIDGINAFTYLFSSSRDGGRDARTIVSELGDQCLPLMRLGSSYDLQPVSVIDGLSDADDLDRVTLDSVTWRGRYHSRVYQAAAAAFEVSTEVRAAIAKVEEKCNCYLGEVLMNPPTLRFSVPEPDQLLRGGHPRWEFEAGGVWVPITELSSAQIRWANLAIGLAVAKRYGRPTMFLCDEPERGLHRLAEQRVSKGLASLVHSAETGIIAATHSPLIIGSAAANRVLTYRDTSGSTALRPWSLPVADPIDAELAILDLGLVSGDLLQLMNLAVVVEGLHDEYVLNALLRRQLNDASAGIFSMRGAAHAKSLAEAKVLFRATNGPILVVVDGLINQHLAPLWREIKAADRAGETAGALSKIGQLSTLRVEEAEFLAELAKAAVESKTLQRIEVHGLSLPDIICYLPESSVLLRDDESWNVLLERWVAAARNNNPRNIKGFLKNKSLLPKDTAELNERVRDAAIRAASTISIVHPDLVALGDVITELAQPGES